MQTFKVFLDEALVPLTDLGIKATRPKSPIKDKQGHDVVATVVGKRGGKYYLVTGDVNGRKIIQAFRSTDFETHHSTSPTDMIFPVSISGYHYFIDKPDGLFASRTPFSYDIH